MIEIKVIWHKNPDTDSICSAVIMSDFLNKKWFNAIPYKLWKLNNETKYLFDLLKINIPETIEFLEAWTKIALVDHNEKTQTIDNIEELDIEYIVDHHKFELSTTNPINIRAEKLCSTASVLYKMYVENNFEITKNIWILMLSAILSDSLLFKSKTTTSEDKTIVKNLQQITWINDLENFMKPLFDAKSDLWDMSIEDIIKYDYKTFEVNNIKFWIWTLETTNPNYSLSRKNEFLNWLEKIKKQEKLNFIILSIVDIFWEKNTSIVLDWNDSNIIKKVFHTEVKDNLANLWKRLSRKKEIIPDLTNFFQNN